jgi:hypothetical protein
MSLGEVVSAGRLAEVVSEEGATLRYRPELQRLGHGAIVEVSWPDGDGGASFGLVEVYPDGWGGLGVSEANVPNDDPGTAAKLRLPSVPTEGWRHTQGCDCPTCRR